jgi:hypothetical protein
MKILPLIAIAAFTVLVSASNAKADDFVELCVKANQAPGMEKSMVEKSCSCASGKVAAKDRAAAIDFLKASITATASGKPEDMAAMMGKNGKGAEIMMTAQATCM